MTKTFGNFTDLMDFSRASTATFLGSDGLIQTAAADTPRIEYDTDGTVKGLLIEEARTNLAPYSEDTSQWSEVGTTTITNQTQVAPDGTSTATLVDIGATGDSLGPNRTSYAATGLTAGNTATVSVYLKKPDTNAASHISVRAYCPGTTATDAYVDYRTSDFETVNISGQVDTVHASQEVGNGWYRVSFTFTLNASGTGAWDLRVGGLISGGYTATGTDFIFWGAQIEQGSFATSYIPTSGATATRSADIASIAVENFGYNQDEGTVVVEASIGRHANYARLFELKNADNLGIMAAYEDPTRTNDYVRYVIKDDEGNARLGAETLTGSGEQSVKIAMAYAPNDFAIYAANGQSNTSSFGEIGTGAKIYFGTESGSNNYLNGHIRDFQYYPRRLTNRQLQELTGATNTYDYTTVEAGTITRSPVATGSDLVAYSGWSASNYLEQPYNSDLDFGTGDFCVMGWVLAGGNSYRYIASYGDGDRDSGYRGWFLRNGAISGSTTAIQFRVAAVGGIDIPSIPTSQWVFVAAVRASGVSYIYSNGELKSSGALANDVDVTNATLRIGHGGNHSIQDIGSIDGWSGSLALLRISATAPTAEQIAKIYEDEKVLFQEAAQATLYGSSDAVTALAHDDVTNLLHVGTSAGRSVFQGLRRVENTTNAVGTAISASNGMVVEE